MNELDYQNKTCDGLMSLNINVKFKFELEKNPIDEAAHPRALLRLGLNMKRAERYGLVTTCKLQDDEFLDEEWRATIQSYHSKVQK
ncbi:hypothetical protein ACSBR2_014098 [Camellia fascicularis]